MNVLLAPSLIGAAPYQRQLAALPFRVVVVDLDDPELTFDRAADAFERAREAAGAERVIALGHSIAGMFAIEYARRFPARVSHVIAVGTPPHGDMAALQEAGRTHFEAHASAERKQQLADNLARLPPGMPPAQAVLAQSPLRFFDPRYDAAPLYEGATPHPEAMMRALGVLGPAWRFAPIARPLWVALGRHDYVVPCTIWDGVHDRVTIFEESGHQPFVEEPARFAREAERFVSLDRE